MGDKGSECWNMDNRLSAWQNVASARESAPPHLNSAVPGRTRLHRTPKARHPAETPGAGSCPNCDGNRVQEQSLILATGPFFFTDAMPFSMDAADL